LTFALPVEIIPESMPNFRRALRIVLAVLLVLAICATSAYSAEKAKKKKDKDKKKTADWEILFDGSSTEKWRGYKKTDFPNASWKFEDGVLKTNPQARPVDLISKDQYDNFDLRVEWKVTPGANSGIIYRANEEYDEPWQSGPEMQVLDDDKHADGKDPKTSAGSLYALIAPKDKTLKPVGKWNKVRVIARGKHIEHWLNGKKIVEYEMGSPELADLIKKSKFAVYPKFATLPSGHIVLQHHKDEVWFRDVKIRRLDENESKK